MTIYVMLGNLKSAAFEKMDSLEERDMKAKKVVESLGGKMLSLYYTFGRYDFVVVRTETLETIPADLMYKIAKEI